MNLVEPGDKGSNPGKEFPEILRRLCNLTGASEVGLYRIPANICTTQAMEIMNLQKFKASFCNDMSDDLLHCLIKGSYNPIFGAGENFDRFKSLPCLLCVRIPLNRFETVILLLGFTEDSRPLSFNQCQKLLEYSLPFLMWGKYVSKYQSLINRFTELRENSYTSLTALIENQEAEREWLAIDIHDRIAQNLATVFNYLQSLESKTKSSPEIRSMTLKCAKLCKDVIRETRNIMKNLSPPMLEELGLIPVIEDEIRQIKNNSSLLMDVKFDLPCRLEKNIEVSLYRIFQEAMINIQKHANASKVSVFLEYNSNNNLVVLLIKDDGDGFNPHETNTGKRVGGLMSMERRSRVVNGRFEIRSNKNEGTEVSIQVPVYLTIGSQLTVNR